jgi:hypothetical protein
MTEQNEEKTGFLGVATNYTMPEAGRRISLREQRAKNKEEQRAQKKEIKNPASSEGF